jgi:hypothetical protein
MMWDVRFQDDFDLEFCGLPVDVQDQILSGARLLQDFGPSLGRPHVDTLKGSSFPNMKEMRFKAADGEWRVAFAFDPARAAILLVGGDKAGVTSRHFYTSLIATADRRFRDHLAELARGRDRRP